MSDSASNCGNENPPNNAANRNTPSPYLNDLYTTYGDKVGVKNLHFKEENGVYKFHNDTPFTTIQWLVDKRTVIENDGRGALLLAQIVKCKSKTEHDSSEDDPKKKQGYNTTSKNVTHTYDRVLYLMDLNADPDPSKSGRNLFLCIISTAVNANEVFSSNLSARDEYDGIGVGAIVALYRPQPVKTWMGPEKTGIPIVEFDGAMRLLGNKMSRLELPTINVIEAADDTRMFGFSHSRVKIHVNKFALRDINCYGTFCDGIEACPNSFKQRRGCSCFTTRHGEDYTTIVLLLDIKVEFQTDKTFMWKDEYHENHFTSKRLTNLVFQNSISVADRNLSIKPEVMDQALKYIRTQADFINKHGGWSISGWYCKGKITDVVTDEQMCSNNKTVHFSYIMPTDLQDVDLDNAGVRKSFVDASKSPDQNKPEEVISKEPSFEKDKDGNHLRDTNNRLIQETFDKDGKRLHVEYECNSKGFVIVDPDGKRRKKNNSGGGGGGDS